MKKRLNLSPLGAPTDTRATILTNRDGLLTKALVAAILAESEAWSRDVRREVQDSFGSGYYAWVGEYWPTTCSSLAFIVGWATAAAHNEARGMRPKGVDVNDETAAWVQRGEK